MQQSPSTLLRYFLPSLLSSTISTICLAQDSSSFRLEEVIVTAQKRAESLQDVPISVAAVSGEKLAESGIETLEDLTVHIPNIHFTETGFSTQVRVRGIGSDNSQGFEQSVGMYIDGIYHGRAQLFRTPMMDMERAEMLRGPQSTLFGKNSIAGALNLTTARPTEELEGHITYSYEFEHEQQEFNGVVSGPLTEDLRARLAVRGYTEEGYVHNSFTNEDQPQSDETAVRLSLEWDASDDLSFFLKAENNQFETKGRAIELTRDVPIENSPLNPFGLTYAQIMTSPPSLGGLGQPSFEANGDYVRQYDFTEESDNEINNLTLTADYALGEHTLTLVSGYLDFTYDELCDCDNTPSNILDLKLGETYDQFSQEIRFASPVDEKVDWIAGLFYQTWDQTFYDDLSVPRDNFLPSVAATLPGRGALALMADTGLRRDFDQNSDSWAGFGRATWHVNERLHLTLGARYTEETKDASKIIEIYDTNTGVALPADTPTSPVGLVYKNVFGVESEQLVFDLVDINGVPTGLPVAYSGHNVSTSRKEKAFNPLVNIEFDINENMMSYFSYTTGFKAGGFDPRSNSVGNFAQPFNPAGPTPPPEENPFQWFEFEEEKAVAYELGLKNSIGGRGEINIALYRTEYEDLQISQFDGRVGFNVGNVNETVVQGIEIDGRWALTDKLIASYGLSWLDFEYTDFPNGNCYAGQAGENTDVDGDGDLDLCDYTGKRGPYTPEYTMNVSLDYRQTVFNDVEFVGLLDWQYVDGHNVHVNLDPNGEIDAYNMVGLRLGLDAERWGVALLGKNLLDEYVLSYSANAPLSESTFGTNTYYSFVRRPMTFALEGTFKF